jgi:hypothetical protein
VARTQAERRRIATLAALRLEALTLAVLRLAALRMLAGHRRLKAIAAHRRVLAIGEHVGRSKARMSVSMSIVEDAVRGLKEARELASMSTAGGDTQGGMSMSTYAGMVEATATKAVVTAKK